MNNSTGNETDPHYFTYNISLTMTLLDSTSTFIFLGLIAYLFWFQRCRGVYTKTDRQYKIIIMFYFLSVAISGINWILF
jgi:hypothetical protein